MIAEHPTPPRQASARLLGVDPAHEQLVLNAFENAPRSLSLADLDGNIVYANDLFWETFRHPPGTPLRVADLSRPDDLVWTAGYLALLASGTRTSFETVKHFVRGDGTEFDADLAIQPVFDGDRACVGMIATVEPTDVRPKSPDARATKLLEHIPSSLTQLDGNGEIVETTGRYRATMGYPAEFWENRSVFDLLVPEELPRAMEMRERVLAQPGETIVDDFRVIAANREIETVEFAATNLLDDPDVNGVVVMTTNVTEERANRRAVEAQHRDAVAEAERRSHLLATVSHEIRNPLHGMTGLAELLASDSGLTGAPHDLAVAIQRQLDRLAAVADDLLDSAQLDVGELRLRPSPQVVRDVIDDVERTARSSAGDRLDVVVDVDETVPFAIVIDGARLQQILSNLVGNAIKFTDEGSVTLSVTRADEYLRFRVADTGPGIEPDQLDRLFQPFARVSGGGDRRGAGLGLAIVSQLVEAMDGTVTVDSTVGDGTTFTVDLPLVETDRTVDIAATAATSTTTSRCVLVIEDRPINQDLARAQLTRLGHGCVIVGSAEDGLALLGEEAFDAVLMDHQLPGMNGREATTELRRRGHLVPVIGVTASSTAADERACLEAGMNAFLPKPVGLERLGQALTQVWTTTPDVGSAATDDTIQPAEESALDNDVLATLVHELGDRATVERLVESFLAELDARSADIIGDDTELAARQAHTLKSSAALLGASELARACATAEHEPTDRADLHRLVEGSRRDLRAWIGGG